MLDWRWSRRWLVCAVVLNRSVVRKAVLARVWMVVTRLFVVGLAVRDALPPSSSPCGGSGTVVVCIYPALFSAPLPPASPFLSRCPPKI